MNDNSKFVAEITVDYCAIIVTDGWVTYCYIPWHVGAAHYHQAEQDEPHPSHSREKSAGPPQHARKGHPIGRPFGGG
jgi:hypothetical protein